MEKQYILAINGDSHEATVEKLQQELAGELKDYVVTSIAHAVSVDADGGECHYLTVAISAPKS